LDLMDGMDSVDGVDLVDGMDSVDDMDSVWVVGLSVVGMGWSWSVGGRYRSQASRKSDSW